jgi:hypothetical protein
MLLDTANNSSLANANHASRMDGFSGLGGDSLGKGGDILNRENDPAPFQGNDDGEAMRRWGTGPVPLSTRRSAGSPSSENTNPIPDSSATPSARGESGMVNGDPGVAPCVSETKAGFNFNKFQAVACMAVSAAVSIVLIYLGLQAVL